MDYFMTKYDIKIDKPKPKTNITDKEFNSINPMVKETSFEQVFCDFIAYEQIKNSYYVISDELKKVFEMYSPNLESTALVFSNALQKKQKLHWIIRPEVLDCIAATTTYLPTQMVKELILSNKNINGKNIFLVKSKHQTFLITSLDATESILRRGFIGLKFTKVKIEG
jgi:poly(3-hydroxyalkanoate) synthetase